MFKTFLKERDIVITIILTILCIIFVSIPLLKQTPVRIFLGLPFLLFLPGYSLIISLFPKRDDLGWIERTTLSFGLSIIIISSLGFGLNYTPLGIRLAPILVVISIFTISLSLIAWVRRLKLSDEERFNIPFDRILNVNLGHGILDKVLSIFLIASVMVSFATLAYVVVMPKTGERFTEFYLLGTNGTASDYPTEIKVGEEGIMIIGIINKEYENITYLLEVSFNGTLIHKESFFLIENEKLEIPFTFKAINKVENQKLEFLLYKNQLIEHDITLHLWISVRE